VLVGLHRLPQVAAVLGHEPLLVVQQADAVVVPAPSRLALAVSDRRLITGGQEVRLEVCRRIQLQQMHQPGGRRRLTAGQPQRRPLGLGMQSLLRGRRLLQAGQDGFGLPRAAL